MNTEGLADIAKARIVFKMYKINTETNLILSYSSMQTLSTCPRKFELRKIHPMDDIPRDTSAALSNGKAVGVGFATFLETNNIDLALLETWHNYYPPLEDNLRSISLACVTVERLADYCSINLMDKYKLAVFEDKPATELSFGIKLAPNVYYIGYLDAVLEDRDSGVLLPLELKTTSMYNNLIALYKNSAQGISYGLVVDKINGTPQPNYDILYLVAQLHRTKADKFRPTIQEFPFRKTMMDRLEWLIGLQLDVQRIQAYMEVEMFPRNGSGCVSFGSLCPFFGVCTLKSQSTPVITDTKPEIKEVQFMFDLQELISDALGLV